MSTASVRQYQWVTSFGVLLICVDLCINSAFLVYCQSTFISLTVYIIQDVCLIFSIILLAVASFSTSLMKIGIVGAAAGRLKWSSLGVLSYLALSLGFHTVSLQQQWYMEHPESYTWTDPMLAFFSVHRVSGVVHYYLFKRALFRLSDKKYYE